MFGYHPLADLDPPGKVLGECVDAVRAGFDGLFIPDHFHPWSLTEGSSFAWTLVAGAAERTGSAQVGTAVTCPTLRYNPAVVAQAFATLGATYEGRIFLGVGTGEALNEVPTGNAWPGGAERLGRLKEAIEVIRSLWQGGTRSFEGRYYRLRDARLFSLPKRPVPIYVSGFGPKAAALAGSAGDGWMTGGLPESVIRGVLAPAFEKGAADSGRDPAKLQRIVELLISYDEDREKAVESCRRIAGAMVPEVMQKHIHDPAEIKRFADEVPSKAISDSMLVFDDLDQVISKLESYIRLGFNWIEVGSLSPDNGRFIDLLGKNVLPYLRGPERATSTGPPRHK